MMSRLRTNQLSGVGGAKRHYRVTVFGAAAVGKTCIVSHFLQQTCPSLYLPTVEDFYRQRFYLEDGSSFEIDIIDTAGAYSFPAMSRLAITTSDSFILVYAVDDATSFEEVKVRRQQIFDEKGDESTPIVIVGNKSDLPGEKRVVERSMVQAMLTNNSWNIGHVETSAKDNVNISDVFEELMMRADLKVNLRLTLPSTVFNVAGMRGAEGLRQKRRCHMRCHIL